MENNWKNKTKSYEEYDKIMRESSRGAPQTDEELEEALKEFGKEWDAMSEKEKEEMRKADRKAQALARGDYSSLSPELRKIFEKRKPKKSKIKKSKKDTEISL